MSIASSRVTGLRVFQAGYEHIDKVAPLFDAYRQFYGQPANPEGARRFIRDRLAGLESVIYLAVGEIDDAERSLGFVQLYPAFSSVSMQRIWILNDLYVSDQARRGGVGLALIEKARHLAEATDAKGLILSTSHENHTAQALYHEAGFVRDDEFYHYFLPVMPSD